jgi:hypothetical protein
MCAGAPRARGGSAGVSVTSDQAACAPSEALHRRSAHPVRPRLPKRRRPNAAASICPAAGCAGSAPQRPRQGGGDDRREDRPGRRPARTGGSVATRLARAAATTSVVSASSSRAPSRPCCQCSATSARWPGSNSTGRPPPRCGSTRASAFIPQPSAASSPRAAAPALHAPRASPELRSAPAAGCAPPARRRVLLERANPLRAGRGRHAQDGGGPLAAALPHLGSQGGIVERLQFRFIRLSPRSS